jgi:hypothetical protein
MMRLTNDAVPQRSWCECGRAVTPVLADAAAAAAAAADWALEFAPGATVLGALALASLLMDTLTFLGRVAAAALALTVALVAVDDALPAVPPADDLAFLFPAIVRERIGPDAVAGSCASSSVLFLNRSRSRNLENLFNTIVCNSGGRCVRMRVEMCRPSDERWLMSAEWLSAFVRN